MLINFLSKYAILISKSAKIIKKIYLKNTAMMKNNKILKCL